MFQPTFQALAYQPQRPQPPHKEGGIKGQTRKWSLEENKGTISPALRTPPSNTNVYAKLTGRVVNFLDSRQDLRGKKIAEVRNHYTMPDQEMAEVNEKTQVVRPIPVKPNAN